MTDKSAAAVREFAEKIVPVIINSTVLCNTEEIVEAFTGDLTALIEEHYYPKEFVEWMLKCSAYSDVPFREFTLKWNINVEPDIWRYFTTDELYQYWKEDVR